MNTIYILTGGNMGDRMTNLKRAEQVLENEIGEVEKSSSVYETAAWGNQYQPDFYNQVHIIKTSLAPGELMETILKIEEKMGRTRTVKNAARIIDIDILFYNDQIISQPGLTLPHPEIPNRRFVLEPLTEIAPDLIHPVLQKKIKDLLSTSKDPLQVTRIKVP